MEKVKISKKEVVIFDGVCNLCNASVDFLMRKDTQRRFFFTANQSEAGRTLLEAQGKIADDVSTIYFWDGQHLFERSTAALQIARRLPYPWKLLWGFIIFPKFFRDGVYNWIARNRYKWFGKKETCRLPTPEEQAQFI